MLILTRNIGQTVVFGDDGQTKFTILGIRGNQVRLGIQAPKSLAVNREEIFQKIQAEKNGIIANDAD